MGPCFAAGETRIGRTRLPAGLVAILTNTMQLRCAIAELHHYATTVRAPDRPRRGIVYRIVENWEVDALGHKLRNFYGSKLEEVEADFPFLAGHFHLLDDSTISHACNRHAIAEGAHPHQLLEVGDFHLIPEVVDPRNIVEFSVSKNMPRVVYEKAVDGRTL